MGARMGIRAMGIKVGHFGRVLRMSAALIVGVGAHHAARADGDSNKSVANLSPASRTSTTGSVSVDFSALDSVPNRSLLLPGVGRPSGAAFGDGPVVLRPPAGVKPLAPSAIRLRPTPGVRMASSTPILSTPAPAPAQAPAARAPEP